jgi:hypothetical protein
MYSGEETEVDVVFSNELAGIVIEKFGADVFMYKLNDNQFKAKLKVSVSPFFLSWILGLGKKAEIIAPETVVNKMIDFITTGYNTYLNKK